MIDHERSLRLAAASVSEVLSAREAVEFERHLRSCPTCRREHAALADDHRRLRLLVAPQAVSEDVRHAVLAQVGVRPHPSTRQLLLVAALLALLVAGIAAFAGSRPLVTERVTGFEGTWTATHCATRVESSETDYTFDCGRWGDGSILTLEIGDGDPASIDISGSSIGPCTGIGASAENPPGFPEGSFLFIEFVDLVCGGEGSGPDQATHFFLEPHGRRIWFDDDGDEWGLFWVRPE